MKQLLLACLVFLELFFSSRIVIAAPTADELFLVKFSAIRKHPNVDQQYAFFSLTNKGQKDIDDIVLSLQLIDAQGNNLSFNAFNIITPGTVWLKTGESIEVSVPLDSHPEAKALMQTKPHTARLKIGISKITFINTSNNLSSTGTVSTTNITRDLNSSIINNKSPINYFPVYERICQYGHPILITGWSLDESTRFIHFKNPEHEKNPEKNSRYFYIALNNEDGITTQWNYSDAEQYKENTTYDEDLKKLQNIPITAGLSRRESDIASIFGKWDYKHMRKNGYKAVFARPFCLQNQLLLGLYYEMENDSIIKVKGIITKKGLISDIHDYRVFSGPLDSPSFNNGVHHYGDEPHLKDGPIDTLLDFILFKELGNTNEASNLLTYESRNNQQLYSQSETDIEIDTTTLTYQATSRDNGSYKVLVEYALKNGKSIKSTYEMLFTDRKWKVSQ